MSDKTRERVLGLPTVRFHQAGLFQGFRPFDPALFAYLLDPAHLRIPPAFRSRNRPDVQTAILYVVFACGEAIFHYQRSRAAPKRGCGQYVPSASAGTSVPRKTPAPPTPTAPACSATGRGSGRPHAVS